MFVIFLNNNRDNGAYGVGLNGEVITICGAFSTLDEWALSDEEFRKEIENGFNSGHIVFSKRDKPNVKLL